MACVLIVDVGLVEVGAMLHSHTRQSDATAIVQDIRLLHPFRGGNRRKF
jgi:hypothetical protein